MSRHTAPYLTGSVWNGSHVTCHMLAFYFEISSEARSRTAVSERVQLCFTVCLTTCACLSVHMHNSELSRDYSNVQLRLLLLKQNHKTVIVKCELLYGTVNKSYLCIINSLRQAPGGLRVKALHFWSSVSGTFCLMEADIKKWSGWSGPSQILLTLLWYRCRSAVIQQTVCKPVKCLYKTGQRDDDRAAPNDHFHINSSIASH